ncbi:MAG: PAS domain S-box protein [Deltaproteobacteria bacterium]|jgi:PAS domain S-box-containing protein|nr:PAS domain S-box protein [Deltaproteobacteria bacterium]
MTIAKRKSNELLQTISGGKIPSDLSSKTARDALSIVIDALNSSAGGLIITDLNGIIRFANPSFCRMFDYSHGDIIDRNAADLFATREVRTFSDVVAIVDISNDDSQEFVVESNEGRSFTVEVTASNVTSSTGELAGRMASFIDITKRKEIEEDREKLINKLQNALNKIKTLSGIIPICASCKKIRDDKGYWNQLENYINEHSEAHFSHGICPECAEKLYPDLQNHR